MSLQMKGGVGYPQCKYVDNSLVKVTGRIIPSVKQENLSEANGQTKVMMSQTTRRAQSQLCGSVVVLLKLEKPTFVFFLKKIFFSFLPVSMQRLA